MVKRATLSEWSEYLESTSPNHFVAITLLCHLQVYQQNGTSEYQP